MKRRALVIVFVALVIASLPARVPARQLPTPVPAPTRIISLVPSVTEMLFAIGAGDRVVGVSNFDHYPPEVEKRTKVGGLLDPDFERILSLRPDLVIVYGTQSGLLERLGRARLPVSTTSTRRWPTSRRQFVKSATASAGTTPGRRWLRPSSARLPRSGARRQA